MRRVIVLGMALVLGCTTQSPYLPENPADAAGQDSAVDVSVGGAHGHGGSESPSSGGTQTPDGGTKAPDGGREPDALPPDPSGLPPCIRVVPDENLNLGDVELGESTTSEDLYIEACGGRTAIRSIRMAEGSDPGIMIAPDSLPELPGNMPPVVQGEAPFQLHPKIVCQPSTIGVLTGIVQIESDDTEHPSVGVIVTCTGVEPSPPDLRVEMTWHTPSDMDETDEVGSDMDLHLVDVQEEPRPNPARLWGTTPPDCWGFAPNPDWGVEGDLDDDPQHHGDDHDGAGPEVITLRHHTDQHTYMVGVIYYRQRHLDDLRSWGTSEVTVRVYVRDVEVWTNEIPVVLTHEKDLWMVGQIQWNNGNPTYGFSSSTIAQNGNY